MENEIGAVTAGTTTGLNDPASAQAEDDAAAFQEAIFQVGLLGAQVAFDELIQQINEDSRNEG